MVKVGIRLETLTGEEARKLMSDPNSDIPSDVFLKALFDPRIVYVHPRNKNFRYGIEFAECFGIKYSSANTRLKGRISSENCILMNDPRKDAGRNTYFVSSEGMLEFVLEYSNSRCAKIRRYLIGKYSNVLLSNLR